MAKNGEVMLPEPLGRILLDIKACIEAELYYPALVVALTLPDICVGLGQPDSVFSKQATYVDFIDTYADAKHMGCSGLDCYRLRGGIIHRGNAAGHDYSKFSHVIFTIPTATSHMHAFSMEISDEFTAAFFDLPTFIGAMQNAVLRWYLANGKQPTVLHNTERLLRLRPSGLLPFVEGGPIVASGVTGDLQAILAAERAKDDLAKQGI